MATNGEGRLLAVGDIHGCLDRLRRLLAKVRPDATDRVVFLGDYIDRGPDGRGVIDFLLDFAERHPQSIFLRGNHEAMFLDFLSGGDQLPFLGNGGAATLESYRTPEGIRIPSAHLDFLAGLRPYHEAGEFIFVHAGLRPGIPLDEQRTEDLLWIRDDFLVSDYDWGKTVVFGHTPLAEPLLSERRIGIDTGAVYGRVLTCCDVKRRRCWNSALPPAL